MGSVYKFNNIKSHDRNSIECICKKKPPVRMTITEHVDEVLYSLFTYILNTLTHITTQYKQYEYTWSIFAFSSGFRCRFRRLICTQGIL